MDKFAEGFVKAAMEKGFSQKDAVELFKVAKPDGPWHMDQASMYGAEDERMKGLDYNKKNHPGHYYLNPAVGGPLTRFITKMNKNFHAAGAGSGYINQGIGGGFAADDSDHAKTKELIAKYRQFEDSQRQSQ